MCAHFSIFLFFLFLWGVNLLGNRETKKKKIFFFFNRRTHDLTGGWGSQLLPWLLSVTTQAGEAGEISQPAAKEVADKPADEDSFKLLDEASPSQDIVSCLVPNLPNRARIISLGKPFSLDGTRQKLEFRTGRYRYKFVINININLY